MKARLTLLAILSLSISVLSCLDNGDDSDSQFEAEVRQIDSYLATLGLTNEVYYVNNAGIRFLVYNYGENPPAKDGQKVIFSYSGKLLLDGTTFDSGTKEQLLTDISPAGLQYAVSTLMSGSTADFYIPSVHAFGQTGTTGVPSNSPVIYTVTVLEVQKTSTELTRFQQDTATIHNFIKNNNITGAVQHSSGIWYKVTEQGTGTQPTPYSQVTFDYTLKSLSEPGSIIQQGNFPNYTIFGLIDGLKSGLPLINQGSKVTFYIPSGLGYGPSGSGSSIPANTNLIFDINLTAVQQ